MQVEIGGVYEGTIKNITKYGAFVELQLPDGTHAKGMVHISEVAKVYVHEIRDYVQEGQQVRVKVLEINQNKISLSMKQAEQPGNGGNKPPRQKAPSQRNGRSGSQGAPARRPGAKAGSRPKGARMSSGEASGDTTFEDMLSRFKQNSEERMGDIKRNTERKNRSRRK